MAKPRLFVEMDLYLGARIVLPDDAHHYITRVMRMKVGAEIEVFNGNSPSFNARIDHIARNETLCEITKEVAALYLPPDLILAFAPIKKARTDFIVEKACELGVKAIQPMMTEFTNSERVRTDRLRRHAIEAAEQCGGNFVPEIFEEMRLTDLLSQNHRQLLFCDEASENGEGFELFTQSKSQSWTILIGPEGGFSRVERESILNAGAIRMSLGPRILRADTAAVAAVVLWQKTFGDWQ